MLKIGCCIDLADIDVIAPLGFDFIDLNGRELARCALPCAEGQAEKLEELNLPCLGLHATAPASIKLAGPDFDAGAVKTYFENLALRAKLFQIRFVGIGSPDSRRLPNGFDIQTADAQMRISLEIVAEAFPDAEVLLESLNESETNYINTYSAACALAESTHSPGIRTVLDVYHFALCGDRADRLTDAQFAQAAYLHIADPNQRAFPSEGMDSDFIALVRTILNRTHCDAIAIEAIARDLRTDAAAGLQTLRKIIETTG